MVTATIIALAVLATRSIATILYYILAWLIIIPAVAISIVADGFSWLRSKLKGQHAMNYEDGVLICVVWVVVILALLCSTPFWALK